jgi:predicted porin
MRLRPAIPLLCGLALAAGAHAQSSVTIYGILDSSVRYSTNENADGAHRWQVGDGMLTGTRLGFRGIEDLGDGLKAKFVLEQGLAPDTGTLNQGGRVFGRQSYVGLEGAPGDLRLGRQYTVAHEIGASFDAMAFANLSLIGYQGLQYTGLRFDNMVRYSKKVGDVTGIGGYAFGESAAGIKVNSAAALGGVYDDGKLRVGGAFQKTNGVATYFSIPVPASQQTFWMAGATYTTEPVKLLFAFTRSWLSPSGQSNRIITTGFHWWIAGNQRLAGNFMHDRLERQGTSGTRLTNSVLYEYYLSKRTNVYAEVDYTRLRGAWIPVGTATQFPTPFFNGHPSHTGFMVGLRNQF